MSRLRLLQTSSNESCAWCNIIFSWEMRSFDRTSDCRGCRESFPSAALFRQRGRPRGRSFYRVIPMRRAAMTRAENSLVSPVSAALVLIFSASTKPPWTSDTTSQSQLALLLGNGSAAPSPSTWRTHPPRWDESTYGRRRGCVGGLFTMSEKGRDDEEKHKGRQRKRIIGDSQWLLAQGEASHTGDESPPPNMAGWKWVLLQKADVTKTTRPSLTEQVQSLTSHGLMG